MGRSTSAAPHRWNAIYLLLFPPSRRRHLHPPSACRLRHWPRLFARYKLTANPTRRRRRCTSCGRKATRSTNNSPLRGRKVAAVADDREVAVEIYDQMQLSNAGEGRGQRAWRQSRVDGGARLSVRLCRFFQGGWLVPLVARRSGATGHGSRGPVYAHRYRTFPRGGGSAYRSFRFRYVSHEELIIS